MTRESISWHWGHEASKAGQYIDEEMNLWPTPWLFEKLDVSRPGSFGVEWADRAVGDDGSEMMFLHKVEPVAGANVGWAKARICQVWVLDIEGIYVYILAYIYGSKYVN